MADVSPTGLLAEIRDRLGSLPRDIADVIVRQPIAQTREGAQPAPYFGAGTGRETPEAPNLGAALAYGGLGRDQQLGILRGAGQLAGTRRPEVPAPRDKESPAEKAKAEKAPPPPAPPVQRPPQSPADVPTVLAPTAGRAPGVTPPAVPAPKSPGDFKGFNYPDKAELLELLELAKGGGETARDVPQKTPALPAPEGATKPDARPRGRETMGRPPLEYQRAGALPTAAAGNAEPMELEDLQESMDKLKDSVDKLTQALGQSGRSTPHGGGASTPNAGTRPAPFFGSPTPKGTANPARGH